MKYICIIKDDAKILFIKKDVVVPKRVFLVFLDNSNKTIEEKTSNFMLVSRQCLFLNQSCFGAKTFFFRSLFFIKTIKLCSTAALGKFRVLRHNFMYVPT